MGDRFIVERADHEHQRIALAEMPEELATHSLFGNTLVDTAHIEVLDIGRYPALRLEHFGEAVEAVVRHFDRCEIRLIIAAECAGFGGRARQGIENRRLARSRQADDHEFGRHVGEFSVQASKVRGRPRVDQPVSMAHLTGAESGGRSPETNEFDLRWWMPGGCPRLLHRSGG